MPKEKIKPLDELRCEHCDLDIHPEEWSERKVLLVMRALHNREMMVKCECGFLRKIEVEPCPNCGG